MRIHTYRVWLVDGLCQSESAKIVNGFTKHDAETEALIDEEPGSYVTRIEELN